MGAYACGSFRRCLSGRLRERADAGSAVAQFTLGAILHYGMVDAVEALAPLSVRVIDLDHRLSAESLAPKIDGLVSMSFMLFTGDVFQTAQVPAAMSAPAGTLAVALICTVGSAERGAMLLATGLPAFPAVLQTPGCIISRKIIPPKEKGAGG